MNGRHVRWGWFRILAAMLVWLWALQAVAREVPITILHTCDLHGHILPTEDYDGHTNVGGLARCATVIKQVRAREKNVLLVDAGDTIQGSAVSYLSDGLVMVKLLNLLRYDTWVWGNHEFDWGLDKLQACAVQAEMPILNANLLAAPGDWPADSPALRIAGENKPFVVRDVDGVKVGIIGLTTPGIPSWSRPRATAGLQFRDSVETLRQLLPVVKAAGAQVLVLVCHQGDRERGDDPANQVNAIARNFPELAVIIGAHSHQNHPELKLGDILYTQAGYYGVWLGRVDLVFDTDKGQVTQRHAVTLLMDERVPLDPDVMKAARTDLARGAQMLRTVVGEATDEFWVRGAPQAETPVHDLLFEAIAEALRDRGVKVDAIVHGLLNPKAGLAPGPVTIGDLWRVVPYENTIGVAQLTPAELREILEEDAKTYSGMYFRGMWGLKWTLAPQAAVGHRVVALTRADGSPLDEKQRLAVAFNSYELASGGLRWNKLRALADRPEAKLVEYDFQTRQAVIDFVRRRGKIVPTLKDWWHVEHRRGAAGNRTSKKVGAIGY
jgi:5'-nucleotidase / UDP-sugar diphosphatase